jgi:hypothetical protein
MKTAVEWLVEKLTNGHYLDEGMKQKIIEQANKMFEEQIMDSYRYGKDNGIDISHTVTKEIPAQQYYNETFKSE